MEIMGKMLDVLLGVVAFVALLPVILGFLGNTSTLNWSAIVLGGTTYNFSWAPLILGLVVIFIGIYFGTKYLKKD